MLYCQLLMPTTAANTLIPHAVLGGYYADDRQRSVVNDLITLHGDDAQCVYGGICASISH